MRIPKRWWEHARLKLAGLRKTVGEDRDRGREGTIEGEGKNEGLVWGWRCGVGQRDGTEEAEIM